MKTPITIKNSWSYGLVFFFLLFIISAVFFEIWEFSNLPVQFFGAMFGVVISAIITLFLLQGQSRQEMKREAFVKIFEQKITVYSEFTEKMWDMLHNEKINEEGLLDLRTICFDKLVFYLNNEQIKNVRTYVEKIDEKNLDATLEAVSEITELLQNDLNTDDEKQHLESEELVLLFKAFNR